MKGFSSYIIICIFIFGISCPIAFGDIGDFDGTEYLKWTGVEKTFYMMGFISGLNTAGVALEPWGYILEDGKYQKDFEKACNDIGLYSITVGQLGEGVEAFYKEFRNRRIKVCDAIFMVEMQIKGKPRDLIDAQTRYLRMQPISGEDLKVVATKIKKFLDENNRPWPNYQEIVEGKFSKEDLLKFGQYVDSNNERHALFCYGEY